MSDKRSVVGRFAPSPTGRMHLGNVASALLSWLSAKSQGGRWILRIEDLDPQRSRLEFARQIEDDLLWLGLTWDEGGIDGLGAHGPYVQSRRFDHYEAILERLNRTGLTYPCRCTRADIMATQAPHQSDGRVIYRGTCRPIGFPAVRPEAVDSSAVRTATRLYVPDRMIEFVDSVYGPQSVNLATHCGDFVVRRADGAWAYQLAVVADDAAMNVTEVVRGSDLLLSAAQQIYLYQLLEIQTPSYCHIPLLCNAEGVRLSKRDRSMSLDEVRSHHTPEEVIGFIAALYGIIDNPQPCSATDLIAEFDSNKIRRQMEISIDRCIL